MKKNKKNLPKEIYLERKKCNCVAQKHQLINNCLGCGKVVCLQEGQGPCLYCGQVVTRPDGNFISNDESLFPSLGQEQLTKVSQERSQAILHKNKLVDRDKSTNLVQNIYDESIDYYDVSQNQWLDEQSRQNAIDKLLQKEKFIEKEQFKSKVYFDPLTGQFVTEQFSYDEESFKNQGKSFMREKEQTQYIQKMKKSKQTMDNRVLKNDKAKQLMQSLRTDVKSKQNKKVVKQVKPKLTQLVLEEQEQTKNEESGRLE